MRVDKLFSSLGLLSRSECKKAVKAGHIMIDGRVVKSPDEQVDPEKEEVFYKGTPVETGKYVYYMLYKPVGCVTAREDNMHTTVFAYIDDRRPDLSPVGRLDKDTTGILLITNDGDLNHRLLSSKYHVSKTYIAKVDGVLNDEDIRQLEAGIDIGDDTPTLPAKASILAPDTASLSIIEGRYHQVKRMFEALKKPVLELHRQSFGPLSLDEGMKPGEIRKLTTEETDKIKAACNL